MEITMAEVVAALKRLKKNLYTMGQDRLKDAALIATFAAQSAIENLELPTGFAAYTPMKKFECLTGAFEEAIEAASAEPITPSLNAN